MDYRKLSILFLSANDFKDKSIQVIRKTPEAYNRRGWSVHYVVSRDVSKSGNYFYEDVVNPPGISIYRFEMPLCRIKDILGSHILRTIVSKIIGILTIIKLVNIGLKVIKRERISVVYGYEMHGVFAAKIIKLILKEKDIYYIHRFMGTWLTHYYKKRKFLKLLLNVDYILALRFQSDLCIMTDDGTMGDLALNLFKSKSLDNYVFWPNGVDNQFVSEKDINELRQSLKLSDEKVIISISRLEKWKRVDRIIKIVSLLKYKNYKYYIIGDGSMKQSLHKMVKELGLEDRIIFLGAIPNKEVKLYLYIADIFISTYDLSNVGNPLLEAIRANKIIFTLDNGDTSRWIEHKKNGYIYHLDENIYINMAMDMDEVFENEKIKLEIEQNIKSTGDKMLWTWSERMDAEEELVRGLVIEN